MLFRITVTTPAASTYIKITVFAFLPPSRQLLGFSLLRIEFLENVPINDLFAMERSQKKNKKNIKLNDMLNQMGDILRCSCDLL